ncbi:MAG TPA: FAD-dependent oxidoreductase [Verrucomicrobiae bacterium]|nr:FAD-dependent oxidoreductase [Verrucomicrobiae bacterium]
MQKQYQCKNTDIVIIGGGILGTVLSYIISAFSNSKIILIEQEKIVGYHTSSRNTGKIHAPFIYNPEKKRSIAKAALYGYDFWKDYCRVKRIEFKEDGILEVSIKEKDANTIYKHLEWGIRNGLEKQNLRVLDSKEVKNIEPNVICKNALLCKRDASVDFGEITRNLAMDAIRNNVEILTCSKVNKIEYNQKVNKIILKFKQQIHHGKEITIQCNYIINASGGSALELAKMMNPSLKYKNIYFRGEYWKAPTKYKHLTNHSIYSVPEFQEFPFLDPHWIIRSNGNREIGPNACPVSSQYGYDIKTNLKEFLPNIYNFVKDSEIKGIKNLILNKEYLQLIIKELYSSISKRHMINRVKKFLPLLKSNDFSIKGISGIRSNLINKDGNFLLNPIFIKNDNAIHVLNYNSPGATGAFSIGVSLTFSLLESRIIKEKNIHPGFYKEKLIEECIKEVNIDWSNL